MVTDNTMWNMTEKDSTEAGANPLKSFNRMDSKSAQDLIALLTAAQHYAQKLDAARRQAGSVDSRGSYSQDIGNLLMHLHNEIRQ